ncbi:MAG TPA: hypothetical protein VIV66_04065 [Pyrinomonadaceae bacterium]
MIRLSPASATFPGAQLILLILLATSLLTVVNGQTRKSGLEDEPLFHEYRGVQIGSAADDVRKKLGNPADKSAEQDFYVLSEKETAQILYDKAGKVVTISVDFMMGAGGVLTPKQIFGGEIEAKPDGSIYKMVRYPKAGCWLSYNRTAGAQPMVTVTLQKIDH